MPLIVRAGAGLIVWLMCVTVTPAWGQGPQLDLPEESGPAEALSAPRKPIRGTKPAPKGGEPETAVEAPAKAPQAEQREKLSKSQLRELSQRVLNRQAADQGNSQTFIVGRFQVHSEFRNLRGPDTELRNIARLDIPFKDRFLARIDVPFFQERYMPGGTSSSGMGDVFIRLGALVYNDPAFQFFVGSEVAFPTGPTSSEDDFGRGKYALGPGVAFGMPIPELYSVAFIRLQQVISVGGDPAQSDLNYSRFRFRLTRPIGIKWWVQMEPEMIIDYTRNGKTALQSEFEIGRKLDEHLRLFVRPAVGFSGDGVPGSYDWFIRIGVRYMF